MKLWNQFLEWAVGDWADRRSQPLLDRLQTLEKATNTNSNQMNAVQMGLGDARSMARSALDRAKAITAMDVPVQIGHSGRGDVGFFVAVAKVNGHTQVHAFAVPPMRADRFRDLLQELQQRYGAIDYADVPANMPFVDQMIRNPWSF